MALECAAMKRVQGFRVEGLGCMCCSEESARMTDHQYKLPRRWHQKKLLELSIRRSRRHTSPRICSTEPVHINIQRFKDSKSMWESRYYIHQTIDAIDRRCISLHLSRYDTQDAICLLPMDSAQADTAVHAWIRLP
jgi:hypothetical protein